MKGVSFCEYCKVQFSWKRANSQVRPRFCSQKCRLTVGTGFRPGGQIRIDELTKEQKLERLKKSFERNVVRQEGCWGWTGPLDKGRYPVMSCRRKVGSDRGHKASWLIHRGEIGKLHVCHRCDNPTCTNPDHLWLGTNKQNNDDKMAKGRYVCILPPRKKGSENGSAKLTEEAVKEIKNLIKLGHSCYGIAKNYSVSKSNILRIKKKSIWKHVE